MNNKKQQNPSNITQYLTYAVIVIIGLIILRGAIVRRNVRAVEPEVVSVPEVITQKKRTTVLTAEELAQVQRNQELILKEAENLKVKEQLVAERKAVIAEYDSKIKEVESKLSVIRESKLSFTSRPRQDVSQRPLTKQNVGPMVSVLDVESLEKLGITSSYQQPGGPTR